MAVPKPVTEAPVAPVLPVQEWAARFNDPYWARDQRALHLVPGVHLRLPHLPLL